MTMFRLLAQTQLNPNVHQLPGSAVIQQITDGIGGWALIAALVGLVIGAVAWAFGQHAQNYQQAYSGRKGVIISGVAALLIGAAPHVVNFFNTLGNGVR
jgi:MFS family permease